MYLNSNIEPLIVFLARLTLTLDVFKLDTAQKDESRSNWLTLTLDVFK